MNVECKIEIGAQQASKSMPFPVWSTTGERRTRQQGLGRECEPGTIGRTVSCNGKVFLYSSTSKAESAQLALMALLLFTAYLGARVTMWCNRNVCTLATVDAGNVFKLVVAWTKFVIKRTISTQLPPTSPCCHAFGR